MRTTPKSSGQSGTQHRKVRQTEPGAWEARVAYAAKHLEDPIALSTSPLTRLKAVQQHASSHYKHRVCANAFALRDLLQSSIDRVVEETAEERGLFTVHRFLVLFREGHKVSEISRRLSLSREHVSRVYRKTAFRLITVKFLELARVRGKNKLAL